MSPTFEAAEFEDRLARFQKVLDAADVPVAVVTTPENICYLTGHQTPGYYTYQCLVVPAAGEPILLTRETEVVNGRESTYLSNLEGYPDVADPLEATAALVRRFGGTRVGLEANSWYFTPFQRGQLLGFLGGTDVVDLDDELAQLRLIKSPAEIAYVRRAAAITNAAFDTAARAVRPGVRERDVAAVLFATMITEGSEYVGMEPFVASGPRAGTIHASWSDREIRAGEGVLLEAAASKGRYHAPLMHTVRTSPLDELDELNRRMALACLAARDETVALVRPGNTPAQAHLRCREVIDEHGLLHTYRKRSGYSVGLAFAPDWGEGHILSLKETEHRPFEPGLIVHVVPTLRSEATAGWGFSATLLITDDGHEVLTACPVAESW
ncbi:Xaa-Pro peptidase family protein [Kineosporia mesophila]|uniref:Xaa-Pro peptidase family protein n=1 Tax=Kineosporia mesophila TaxID=566012 RepID=A0ABP6ZNU6_9ACTN|nr:Xaa-Pro peptidase family protein [Kineosporia mesophila]MCD5355109.1 Xaa-Pro peptidase family protein [Kineosporia mesophila]